MAYKNKELRNRKLFVEPCYSPGGCCELMVSIDLMKMGYEVYKNIVNHQYFDFLVYKEPSTFIKIEVTTGYITPNDGRHFLKHKKHLDYGMY
jgi:hypothetical protein